MNLSKPERIRPDELQLPPRELEQAAAVCRQVMGLKVVDADSYAVAVELGKTIKAEIKGRLEFFRPIKQSMDAAKQTVLDAEKGAIAPLNQALVHLDSQATAWRREEERKLAERRKVAEDEAKKRIEETRAAEAAAARAKGQEKLALALETAPVDTPKDLVPSTIPAVSGLKKRTNWKFRVVDAAQIPREYLTPDLVKIGEHVREQKENAKIAGVEVYADDHTI